MKKTPEAVAQSFEMMRQAMNLVADQAAIVPVIGIQSFEILSNGSLVIYVDSEDSVDILAERLGFTDPGTRALVGHWYKSGLNGSVRIYGKD